MKKPVLIIIVMLLLQSCAWIYKLNPDIGKKYMVRDIDDVVFYEGPSLKSPSFYLKKSEEFIVVIPVCPEGKFFCIDARFKGIDSVFNSLYKVRFDSGKEAYITYKDFEMVKNYQAALPNKSPAPLVPPPVVYSLTTDVDMVNLMDVIISSMEELSFRILGIKDDFIVAEKSDASRKITLGMNLKKENSLIKVTVAAYIEQLSYPRGDKSIVFIDKVKSDGFIESAIIEKINSKLKP